MRSSRPKVLHEILGRPLLGHVLDTLAQLGVKAPAVVIGAGGEEVKKFLRSENGKISVVWQREQKGTGHAVEMARPVLGKYAGEILIWPGDMPLLKRETLEKFIAAHRRVEAAVSVLSAMQPEPKGYGRIIRNEGSFFAIREELDATDKERLIQEVNTGVYLFSAAKLFGALKKIKPANRKKEFYLTDTIEILVSEKERVEAFPFAQAGEAQGINSRVELGEAVRTMKNSEIRKHQEQGVTFAAPDQTFVEPGVKIGEDTVVYPWCYIESGVTIGKNCQIGPFAKIRKGTVIGNETVIGSFVEINRSKIGDRVNAKHLTYLGDAMVGAGTNFGAGTVTANYDGKHKHPTKIGKKVFVGSNTVIVAPAVLEDGAKTGAGSVVTGGSKVKKGQVVVGVPARPLVRTKKR